MMVLYLTDWTNTGFSFILLTVNLFRHSTLTELGLYIFKFENNILLTRYKLIGLSLTLSTNQVLLLAVLSCEFKLFEDN